MRLRLPGSLGTRLRGWVHEHVFSRPGRVRTTDPVFSFSFDDVRRSAYLVGAPLVEAAGGRATFYVVGKLAEGRGGDDWVTLADAADLETRGHHVGCHSYSHPNARQIPARALRFDAARNRYTLGAALRAPLEDFAWPASEITLGAKRALRGAYRSLRGGRAGINAGRVDLACLRAVSIYGPGFRRAKAMEWIERCVEMRGWLIFYTHGIAAEPGPIGTTTDDLAWLLRECSARGRILNVRQAREQIVAEA